MPDVTPSGADFEGLIEALHAARVDLIRRGLNFTLTTTRGDLDLLGELTGGGGYEELFPHSVELVVFGVSCRCLGFDKLIQVKRAAGRPKDLEAIAELEAIREERRKLGL